MGYSLSSDVGEHPVAVVGAGTLGRRIAAVYAAGGTDVHMFDISTEQRLSAAELAAQPSYCSAPRPTKSIQVASIELSKPRTMPAATK